MGLFDRLLRKKDSDASKRTNVDPSQNPEMIKVYDKYGRELYITKQEWKNKVLIGNLENAKNNPDELYNVLVSALEDGFFEDVVKYAEVLQKIDPIKSRGTTILGIVYMHCNRLNDAERMLTDFLKTNGEDGVILTNLAKVYSQQEEHEKAESTLWHALEIDPNQENGLNWYTAIYNERGGETLYLESLRRIAALPKSWRAKLWIARFALQKNDITTAIKLYKESIHNVESPLPSDFLMQMSGDLGNNGYLHESIQLVRPHFDASLHGIMVGNNLIKTYFELGQLDEAKKILTDLYSQKRPDWRDTLSYWDTELAKKEVAIKSQEDSATDSITIFSIEGPLWCRDSSPFTSFIPVKDSSSINVFIFGSVVLQGPTLDKQNLQLTDDPGRASRAIPLFLSEKISLSTNAEGHTLMPWIQSKGFAVFGKAYEEKELCELAKKNEIMPDFILSVVVDASRTIWEITINIIRQKDNVSIAKIAVEVPSENTGPAILELSNSVINLLAKHAGVSILSTPDWYIIPDGASSSNYLLRLEQQLTITCKNQDFLQGGGVYGEHEMIEGLIFFNLEHPDNKTIRLMLAQTLRQMKKYNPDIVNAYKEKILLLQKEHPLDGNVGLLISKIISEVI